ncbi:cytochrome c oxidase subunit 4 isoform 1, mitochondrial-like [Limulus polyphemus]|uniref:Cytochrome c oxidase subunit 4 n=1 Tax=Limulus polyphemus TaxID=6850 RepID=A0ABM1BIW3_LIMPO|nr:cytochrome c oxidase subunit 4 isoform 1, mitochondrial-like [Limulus polyphemus]
MASNLLKVPIFSKLPSLATRIILPSAAYHRERIGNREVVGFGLNGEPSYIDRTDFPMPAIRFKENSQEITTLREKEKGDWKELSMDEKKTLYRASFCQTFSEMKAPTGEWKSVLAGTFVAMALTVWLYVWMKNFVYQPMPDSFTPEKKAAQLQRIIDLRVNPIEGLASKYDYENNRWKD